MVTHKKGHDKDKYYQLAKDQGYRSRAAFKLIQINKRYDFLRKAKVCIDLCAAPGGWSQVAHKFMPAGSLVIGVDLLPIKALRGIKTIVGDITTASCRRDIVRELQGWKADVVLCDGAPNIGAAYNKDAIVQNELVLAALKTATDHLNKGGVFCTKVYRSVDYNSIVWVLQQLFEDVQTMKPNSSRSQSSEIFLVCLGYIAPKTIDSRLFDVNHVFKEVADPGMKRPDVLHKKFETSYKRQRQGYDDSLGMTLTAVTSVTDFIESKEPVRLLTDFHEIHFKTENCEKFKTHKKTNEDILIALSDLRVLGKIDFKKLLKWRQAMRDEFYKEDDKLVPKEVRDNKEFVETQEVDPEKLILNQIDEMRANIELKKRKELKKKRLLAAKERLRQSLGMNNNTFDVTDDKELFHISTTLSMKDLHELADVDLSNDEDFIKAMQESDDESDPDDISKKRIIQLEDALEDELESDYASFLNKRKNRRILDGINEEENTFSAKKDRKENNTEYKIKKNKEEDDQLAGSEDSDEDDEKKVIGKVSKRRTEAQTNLSEELDEYMKLLMGKSQNKSGADQSDDSSSDNDSEDYNPSDSDDDKKFENRKVVTKGADSINVKTSKWFNNPLFKSSTIAVDEHESDDEDEEFDFMPKTDKELRKEKRKKEIARQEKKNSRKQAHMALDDDDEVDLSNSKSQTPFEPSAKKIKLSSLANTAGKNDFEIVPQEKAPGFVESLLPERVDQRVYDSDTENYDSHDRMMTLALGTYMLRQSRKKALIDASYNRYSWNDPEQLPSWFLDDELRHNKPQIPVPTALLDQIKNKYQLTGTKVIKKVAEARARKRKRAAAKLKAAKKQATVMAENNELSEKQKLRAMSKALKNTKIDRPSKVYVTTKKTKAGSVGHASAKGKGKLKFVDKRMKKETRAMKRIEKNKKKGRK